MEKIWGEGNVAFSRHTFGDITNMGVHAENLHKHQYSGTQDTVRRADKIPTHRLTINTDMDAFCFNFHRKSSLPRLFAH